MNILGTFWCQKDVLHANWLFKNVLPKTFLLQSSLVLIFVSKISPKAIFKGDVKFKEKKQKERCRESERMRWKRRDDEMIIILIVVIVVEFLNATSVGNFIFGQDFLDAQAVFRIVVERVDILIAINFYLHSNFTVQMARLSDSCPCH